MTLPFDDKSKRKFQCFVCGESFEELNLFREHILEKHEEGREYVICPLARCKIPVRDLRMHFKAIHPSEPMPKAGMMKALIWKDISPKTGKMKTRKPKFREGWYESTKMNKSLRYRSGYECTVYECLDCRNDIQAFEPEPFEIPYLNGTEMRKYRPDLLVVYTDGRKELWEIKPHDQQHLQINKDKWHAAENFCQEQGWDFVVVTEAAIEKLKASVPGHK
jgi:hypothetical protein